MSPAVPCETAVIYVPIGTTSDLISFNVSNYTLLMGAKESGEANTSIIYYHS